MALSQSTDGIDMNLIKNRLAGIESRLQALIENHAARLVPAGSSSKDLAFHLVDAMRAGVETDSTGELVAPNYYIMGAEPELAELLDDPGRLEDLSGMLGQVSDECGLRLSAPIALRVESRPGTAPGTINVTAEVLPHSLAQTSTMEVQPSGDVSEVPPGLYMIVDGTRRFSLSASVVNVGRLSDNHLVIDDPRISRRHAQLRFIRGRYVIFDLDSSGGTWVNGRLIRQQELKPGDLVSLAGVPLVYRQEH